MLTSLWEGMNLDTSLAVASDILKRAVARSNGSSVWKGPLVGKLWPA